MLISVFLPDLAGGGAERIALELAEEFVALGNDVDLVLMRTSGHYLSEIPGGVRLIDLDSDRLWTSSKAFRRYLRSMQPDVVLSFMPLANGISGLMRMRGAGLGAIHVGSERSEFSLATRQACTLRERAIQIPLRWGYRRLDGIIAVSSGSADNLRESGYERWCKITAIGNPLSRQRLPIEPGLASRTDAGSVKLLAIGRLELEKGFTDLIEALSCLSPSLAYSLDVLGEGTLLPKLRARVTSLGLDDTVHFHGFISDPRPWYSTCDVLVVPSRQEGFGNVILEAMAHGMQVVATDCAGPREVLQNGRFGLLVEPMNPKAMASTIEKAIRERRSVSDAQKYALSRTPSIVARDYMAYFMSLAARAEPNGT